MRIHISLFSSIRVIILIYYTFARTPIEGDINSNFCTRGIPSAAAHVKYYYENRNIRMQSSGGWVIKTFHVYIGARYT